jgi:hypothetical protein
MRRFILRGLIAALLAAGLPSIANSADGGWKMPNLNPFSGTSGSGGGSPPTSGWKMPKLWPSTGKSTASTRANKRRSNQPSALSRMSTGTQQFFSKTADALTPWDNKKPAPPPKITGSNSIFSQSTKKPEKSDVAPASWWGGSEKKAESPKSVNDFLSMPRP